MRRESAKRDLTVHFAYLAEHASLEVAERFLTAAEKTFADLAQMPRMGALCRFRSPRTSDIRLWRVRGFEKYLILYRPRVNGVDVVRVIHGSTDYKRVL